MASKRIYNPKEIERKWVNKWQEDGVYKTPDEEGEREYVLGMFPYPSSEGLHVGHVRVFTAVDVLGRYLRMKGKRVLQPMGWDAFGLPAENAAIKAKSNPQPMVKRNEENFKRQLLMVGEGYDWGKAFSTTDPEYYKWTQWLFLKLYSIKNKKGERLVYRKEIPINWCPFCKTGLANEEVLGDGRHERCGIGVEQKLMPQWLMRITDYADRLLDDLSGLDWPKGILEMQRNWIGRREGARVKFLISNDEFLNNKEVDVFTTRLDTINGVSFLAISVELASDWIGAGWQPSRQIKEYIERNLGKSEQTRLEESKEKNGIDTGVVAINPANGEKVPVWIANYVVGEVGMGAVMGVPAEDERDREFAKKYGLPIKEVGEDKSGEVEAENHVTYHLRDWIFSRQRYWGEPFPLVYCDKCGDENGVVPVLEEELPVRLPEVESYEPTGTGESPLASVEDWVETKCPRCGGPARRETDTMPNWAGSCWYYLAFPWWGNGHVLQGDSLQASAGSLPATVWEKQIKPAIEKWLPVDWYLGGAEHAVLHLLYARFWIKAFYDLGLVNFKEPFIRLRNRGTVLADDGRKMSKSWGNVVTPDEMVERFGADTLRVYEMFMGPWGQDIAWDSRSLVGCYRFLERVWKLAHEGVGQASEESLVLRLNNLIKKVEKDIPKQKFNTSVAAMMEFVNDWIGKPADSAGRSADSAGRSADSAGNKLSEADLKRFLQVLAPFAPFMTEEIWAELGEEKSIHLSSWPRIALHAASQEETIDMVVQVNGKLRAVISMKTDEAGRQEKVEKVVRADERVAKWLKGREKVVLIPGRLVNFVSR